MGSVIDRSTLPGNLSSNQGSWRVPSSVSGLAGQWRRSPNGVISEGEPRAVPWEGGDLWGLLTHSTMGLVAVLLGLDPAMESAISGLDTGLTWLHGWMPVVAGGAGVWVWRRYGNLGWLLFGLIGGMRWITGLIAEPMALSGDSNLVKWFTVAIAVYATGLALEKALPNLWPRSPETNEPSD